MLIYRSFKRPDVGVTAVERREDPWLCRVEIDAFNSFAPSKELPLNVQTHGRCCMSKLMQGTRAVEKVLDLSRRDSRAGLKKQLD